MLKNVRPATFPLVGYSTSEGIILSGGFSQNNIFGTGNSLSLEVNTSKSSRTYAANFTQPYITTSGISQSFEIYDRRLDLDELEITDDVKYETYGAGVTYGIPITENDQIFLGGKFEMTDVTLGANAPQRYREYVHDYGDKPKSGRADIGLVQRQPRQYSCSDQRSLSALVR